MNGPLLLASAIIPTEATCTASQSALQPAGIQSQHILSLGSTFFLICLGVYFLVMGCVLWAIATRWTNLPSTPAMPPPPGRERMATRIVGTAVAITIVVL